MEKEMLIYNDENTTSANFWQMIQNMKQKSY